MQRQQICLGGATRPRIREKQKRPRKTLATFCFGVSAKAEAFSRFNFSCKPFPLNTKQNCFKLVLASLAMETLFGTRFPKTFSKENSFPNKASNNHPHGNSVRDQISKGAPQGRRCSHPPPSVRGALPLRIPSAAVAAKPSEPLKSISGT